MQVDDEGGISVSELEGIKRQLFVVAFGNIRFVCWAMGREDAKRQGYSWIGGNVDSYVVTPLSEPGDRVHIALTLSI